MFVSVSNVEIWCLSYDNKQACGIMWYLCYKKILHILTEKCMMMNFEKGPVYSLNIVQEFRK